MCYMLNVATHAASEMTGLPHEMCELKKRFEDNHKIMIMSSRVAT
jgi:hypothetical protein